MVLALRRVWALVLCAVVSYTLRTAAAEDGAPGYVAHPGFDMNKNTDNLVLALTAAGQVDPNIKLCGLDAGVTLNVTACGALCTRVVSQGCTGFVHDSPQNMLNNSSPDSGCCYLKNSSETYTLSRDERYDSYVAVRLDPGSSPPPAASIPNPAPNPTGTNPPRAINPSPIGTNPPAAIPSAKQSSSLVVVILGAVGGSIAALLVVGLFLFLCFRKKRYGKGTDERKPLATIPAAQDVLQGWYSFTYEELFAATGGFSPGNVLGKGASSTVYKGTLGNGAVVAVKVIVESAGEAYHSAESFEREIRTMGRIRHRNLVSLHGCGREGATRLIVLDYAANGSVADALAGKGPFLDWPTRVRVAEDAARGLNYLHNDIVPACLHRDIKPANILLDDQLNAQVADFGLAKHVTGEATHVETRVAGTFGFMAPECMMTGNATKAGDVYAFGGFLLVLITGRPMVQKQPDGSAKSLIQWIMNRTLLEDPAEFTDRSLGKAYSPDEAKFLMRLALGCVARVDVRPDMATVLRLLSALWGGRNPSELAAELPPLTVPNSEHGHFGPGTGSGFYPSSSSNHSGSRSYGLASEQSMTMEPITVLVYGR